MMRINADPKQKPRIYADFQKWEGPENSRRLILTCSGTFTDIARLNLQLVDGMEVTVYMDDADKDGNYDELEADGVVHFDAVANYWVAIVDWNLVRHASDRA
jgi:hypothetical protein